jgi:hypothetical protein
MKCYVGSLTISYKLQTRKNRRPDSRAPLADVSHYGYSGDLGTHTNLSPITFSGEIRCLVLTGQNENWVFGDVPVLNTREYKAAVTLTVSGTSVHLHTEM